MNKQKGLTLLGALVVIGIIVLALAIIIPPVIKIKNVPRGVLCGTNLKGLGTAMTVYAHDYDGRYPQLPGTGPWAKELGFPYDLYIPNFSPGGVHGNTPRTVTASWYLLVREADVSLRSLICPQSDQIEFDGKTPKDLDVVQLWDFGPTPHKHVSYALHNPYGRFPANEERNAAFAVAADMSPWFKDGDILPPGHDNTPPQLITFSDKLTWCLGNSLNHRINKSKAPNGQNVLFADGHTSYETQPNTGVNNDNIYTAWPTDENPTDQDKQAGVAPTGRTPENDAKSKEDSFLVI
jgi:prepilin-type processing-associated H-X9-DG protein